MSDGVTQHDAAVRRVESLVRAARSVADRTSELGRRARPLLVDSTGLSAEGVELALEACLETSPSAAEIDALVRSVPAAPRAHVILPANVFVAAHRAIALALAASARVVVRPSRREPHFASLLAEAAPDLFSLTSTLRAAPGDHVWAYGGDLSLGAIRASLSAGVHLHAQGPGYGAAVVDAARVTAETAQALAADIVPFDQRGCLSPRFALVEGTPADAARFAQLVASALEDAARRIPRGRLPATELADARSFRDASTYSGVLIPAGPGFVAVTQGRAPLAPVGRHLVVTSCDDSVALLRPRLAELTAIGCALTEDRRAVFERTFTSARVSPMGSMQRPSFDGPVDRR
jgi:hypothetical protein